MFETIKKSGWHTLRNAYGDTILRSLFNIYSMTEIDDYDRVQYELVRYMKRFDPDRILVHARVAFYDSGKTGSLTRLMQELVKTGEPVQFLSE